ncbi:MAG: RNA-binding protein [Desulfobulbus propionicus]|nr:MAG: RNA-binding protein [Desulfobulbus propionicus]
MTKGKDFFGKDITDVMEQACKAFDTTQENLNIEVLETGSAGIFGLCRKQAHIRVTLKKQENSAAEAAPNAQPSEKRQNKEKDKGACQNKKSNRGKGKGKEVPKPSPNKEHALPSEEPEQAADVKQAVAEGAENGQAEAKVTPVPAAIELSAEMLETIQSTVEQLLDHMQCSSAVQVEFDGSTVTCNITGEYEEDIIGSEGRTLDSLQYLVRKMVIQSLPDRVVLALNVGDFRERRSEELKTRALELAERVKEDGKTQAIPALNPSERRIVHMVLQEDKGIRSRSVGDGLFKKVLIYKPGKGRRSGAKKKRG